jgi:hypothetical protein
MQIPFSHDAFLDVFGAYNTARWPAVAGLWLATFALILRWIRKSPIGGRGPFLLLAAHWLWSGIAYHWLYFRVINSAAGLFAVAFVLQGVIFGWVALTTRAEFTYGAHTISIGVTGTQGNPMSSDVFVVIDGFNVD